MKFQPDMTSRTKKNHSIKSVVKSVNPHLGLFYEAKKGLLYRLITLAYQIVPISDVHFLMHNFVVYKAIWVSICGDLRVLRN